MAHLQYMPGDPRLVDQLVYELKSKGIFDQFRKDCIADVDTRPAYQNLRQRVENSVSSFLSRQCWKPDLNKNQLREKLRKHILDGNYLEQGVERIVDQVVNPKVASVFIPQVEDLVYNYLGISRKKTAPTAETSNGKISTDDLLPTDLEAVSPGSVKSNDDKNEPMDEDFNDESKMEVEDTKDIKAEEKTVALEVDKPKDEEESQSARIHDLTNVSDEDSDKKVMQMHEDIRLENIPPPDNSPPKVELEKIELPKEPNIACDIPHPDEIPLPKDEKDHYFKPIGPNSDDESSSDSSLRRNMSPLTPIRNYNNENSCDAQQAFENDSDSKSNDKKEPSSFRFAIEAKSAENSPEKTEKKDTEQANLAYQFNNQVNINTFNTPVYDDSSNSNNLQIDYESDVNSKTNTEKVPENDQNTEDKREKKSDDKKSSHKSSHRSRDSYRHTSSKDKRSDSKQSTSRDSSRHDKKPKDDHSKSKSSHKEREKSRDRSEKKDSRDSSKHRSSSHKSSSSRRDSKSHKSSSSRHSSDKKSDDKKSSSSRDDKNKDKTDKSEKSSDRSSKDKRDSKSSSHRSDKDKKSSSKSKHDEKDKKKEKKDTDDHYSVSGRGNHGRRSTDRDSNDGSSSSKGSHNQNGSKTTETKKETKESSSKSDNTSTSGGSISPSDKDHGIITANDVKSNQKPIRVDHLEIPIASPPRLPFVPDVTLKKPKFAANLEEAKRMMKMRKFLDEEQKRMNQEAALLLEFQANVRPSLSQVYSSIPGPELEFACVTNEVADVVKVEEPVTQPMQIEETTTDEKTKEIPEVTPVPTVENEIEEYEHVIKIEIKAEDTMIESKESIEEKDLDDSKSSSLDKSETYNENKPFSQLMDEISEYSKASEKNKKDSLDSVQDDDKKRTEYVEVTIITEEVMDTDENIPDELPESPIKAEPEVAENTEPQEIPVITETKEVVEPETEAPLSTTNNPENPDEENLKYFAEHEKFDAELKRHQFSTFLKTFTEQNLVSNKIHVINCDPYEENILKEVCATFGTFEVVNYYKNGHLRLPKTSKNVVKDINLVTEISLPVDTTYEPKSPSPVFSPVKSECSFELSSDYDAKLEEMVNKTSRQQVMEIILGSVIDETDNPTIDYCTESSIDSEVHLKRKLVEVESPKNNNRHVLAKVRKLSDSDQISSTTEESEEISNNNRVCSATRSKYLGRARRVGLPRPRRNNLPNSPSSDKSVENYEQNTQTAPQTPNGKFKSVTRNKVQRYDTSDLYKPKLHYLSRRNNIS